MSKKYIVIVSCITFLMPLTSFVAIHYLKKEEPLKIKKEIVNEEKEEKKINLPPKKNDDDDEEEEKEEKIVPWLLTYEGEFFSFLLSVGISFLVFATIEEHRTKNMPMKSLFVPITIKRKTNGVNPENLFKEFKIYQRNFLDSIVLFWASLSAFVLDFLILPFAFSLQKFKKESYRQRLKRVFSIGKIIINIIFIIIFISSASYIFKMLNEKKKFFMYLRLIFPSKKESVPKNFNEFNFFKGNICDTFFVDPDAVKIEFKNPNIEGTEYFSKPLYRQGRNEDEENYGTNIPSCHQTPVGSQPGSTKEMPSLLNNNNIDNNIINEELLKNLEKHNEDVEKLNSNNNNNNSFNEFEASEE